MIIFIQNDTKAIQIITNNLINLHTFINTHTTHTKIIVVKGFKEECAYGRGNLAWLIVRGKKMGPAVLHSSTALERCRAEETQLPIIVYNLGTSTC